MKLSELIGKIETKRDEVLDKFNEFYQDNIETVISNYLNK